VLICAVIAPVCWAAPTLSVSVGRLVGPPEPVRCDRRAADERSSAPGLASLTLAAQGTGWSGAWAAGQESEWRPPRR
jgi:hypothetical protein